MLQLLSEGDCRLSRGIDEVPVYIFFQPFHASKRVSE